MKYQPYKAVWELTNACNANCIHCGSKSGQKRTDELTREEALRVCDELAELGCNHVTLMGGEFFLSPYWEAVCERLLSHNIAISPLTNGLLVNKENIEKFKRLGMHGVHLSIDGIGETHNYLRGVPKLFERIIENIRYARAEGFSVGVNTAVSGVNFHELDQLYFLLAELGVWSWQIQVVENVGAASENPDLRMSHEQLYELAKKIAIYRKKGLMQVFTCDNIGFYCYFEPLLRDRPFIGCAGGVRAVGIQADGEVRGCLSVIGCARANEGNVRERSLVDIWNDPKCFTIYRDRKKEQLTGYCKECEYNELCLGGCSALAWSLTGDFSENPFCLHKYEIEAGLTEMPEEEFDDAAAKLSISK